jgi:hypothetical protein
MKYMLITWVSNPYLRAPELFEESAERRLVEQRMRELM